MGARLDKQVQATEARLRQAEQETLPSPAALPEFAKQQPEFAKQQTIPGSEEGAAPSSAETTAAGERQAQLRAIASDLIYWKGGLKVLRQARLPKWRGCFQWQIEARIEALQTAFATLHAEAANGRG